jgi:hypothetical protein
MGDAAAYTTASARQAADRDGLGEWVGRFLCSPGSDNGGLAALLAERQLWWAGPMRLRLDHLHRLAGPAEHPVVQAVDDGWWRDDVDELAERIADGDEPPPVVVSHADGELTVEDGNHRIEALRRAGAEETWAVVGFETPLARDHFLARDGAEPS